MSQSPLCLDTVVRQIIEFVPVYEKDLIRKLKNFQEDLFYVAPEVKMDHWFTLTDILNKSIIGIKEDWHFKIVNVLKN